MLNICQVAPRHTNTRAPNSFLPLIFTRRQRQHNTSNQRLLSLQSASIGHSHYYTSFLFFTNNHRPICDQQLYYKWLEGRARPSPSRWVFFPWHWFLIWYIMMWSDFSTRYIRHYNGLYHDIVPDVFLSWITCIILAARELCRNRLFLHHPTQYLEDAWKVQVCEIRSNCKKESSFHRI